MAGELQFFRSKLSENQAVELEPEPIKEKFILDPNNLIIGPSLISVSDEEEDDDEDEDEDDDEDEDEDDEEDDDEDDEEDDDEDDEDDDDEIKKINIDEIPFNFINEEENNLEEVVDLENTMENIDNIKSIHLEEPIDLNFTNKEHEQMDELLASDLKSISITDLEEPNKKQDYKKMSINKLREVVVEKGIIAEASKLKKQDLLKLLGDE